MSGATDVKDQAVRDALDQAERALDEGDYLSSVTLCVDLFASLAKDHPEFVAKPMPMPTGPPPGPPPLGNSGLPGMTGFAPWPSVLGVAVLHDESGAAHLEFQKQDFSMSEAITYFEYTRAAAIEAER